jgi:hypothetical protein
MFSFNYDIPWDPNRLEQRMGRIHRYGQHKDCLIFNFVATNTIEGRVLQRLLEKIQEIRDSLEDGAVFNVVGEILPAAHIERVLRDYYAGRLGEADLEDRLLRDVDEGRFRAICQNALEGLATKTLNLEMLIERRAKAQERRLVPETIAMRVVMDHEQEKGRQVYDVHEKNLGYDITSLDLNSGELRLIEVKGISADSGTILLTPNERRVAEDRRDCYWLYIVTSCKEVPKLEDPIKDPAWLKWHEVKKVDHCYLSVDAVTRPMEIRERIQGFGDPEE